MPNDFSNWSIVTSTNNGLVVTVSSGQTQNISQTDLEEQYIRHDNRTYPTFYVHKSRTVRILDLPDENILLKKEGDGPAQEIDRKEANKIKRDYHALPRPSAQIIKINETPPPDEILRATAEQRPAR